MKFIKKQISESGRDYINEQTDGPGGSIKESSKHNSLSGEWKYLTQLPLWLLLNNTYFCYDEES